MKKLIPALAIAILPLYLAGEVYAQQPPTANVEQLQDQLANSAGELDVTKALLTRANQEFAQERSMSLRRANAIGDLNNRLAAAKAESDKKDATIKDLQAKLDAAKKPEEPAKAAEPEKPADAPKP